MFVLSVRKLKKEYPGKPPFIAVDEISFDLNPGEILGLLGPNGAGKTTTIQMLLSTLTCTSGSITYFGKDFAKYRSEILQHVAFASTYISLPWQLSIDQNLEIFGRLYGFSKKEILRRAIPLLERFGIEDRRKSLVANLSSGQITRLMLVKAFLIEPKLVLLDEPTASLDPDVAGEVRTFLWEQRKQKGVSILFTSHRMEEVAEICDRVLFIRKGKIVADDVPDKLARSVSRHKVQLILGDGMKRAQAILDRQGAHYKTEQRNLEVELDEAEIAGFLSSLAQERVMYTHIKVLEPTLEDYFLKMVNR